jgi:antitoxin ParD1/3/4
LLAGLVLVTGTAGAAEPALVFSGKRRKGEENGRSLLQLAFSCWQTARPGPSTRAASKPTWQRLPIVVSFQERESIVPTRNINLTEHFDRFVERQVSSGRYSNASEIVRDALRLLEEQEHERAAKLKALRQTARQGFDEIDQGQGIVLKGKTAIRRWIAEIEAEVRTKAAASGG